MYQNAAKAELDALVEEMTTSQFSDIVNTLLDDILY